MEREPLEVTRRLMRAARSLNYNRELQPLVAERIERAEGQLRGHLLARGTSTLDLGVFQVAMDDDGAIDVEYVPPENNWRQMPLAEMQRRRSVDQTNGRTIQGEFSAESRRKVGESGRATEEKMYDEA